jgi:hypothetical protein
MAGAALVSTIACGLVPTPPGQSRPIDYMTAPFRMDRVLGWGTRPDWSPDGTRIAFTESDVRDTHAHEIDLETREVRCLTCWLRAKGVVTRIYYLQDGSFVILAPRGLSSEPNDGGGGPSDPGSQELYWMPASLDVPPQPLEAPAFGEIAISRRAGRDGGIQIAWGELGSDRQVLNLAKLVHDGEHASLVGRRVLYDSSEPAAAGVTFAEAYGFARNDRAVTFFTIKVEADTLNGEMYEVDIASGRLRSLYGDPAHNETHLFPRERYGLEESNRASDPEGSWRGVSSLDISAIRAIAAMNGLSAPTDAEAVDYAPLGPLRGFGRPFDLYVVDRHRPSSPRRLTSFSHLGANAHQSVPAPDGRRIAFALDERASAAFPGEGGLYIGTFG